MPRSEPADVEELDAVAAVEVLVAFLNTFHVELDREDLASPGDLVRWTHEHRLAGGLTPISQQDLSAAHSSREALRRYLADRHGPGLAALAATTADVRVGIAVDTHGVRLEPLGSGWALLWARLVVLLQRAQAAGELSRMKICPGENCAWAFHDRSKNSSRTWCSEQVCGARSRSRNYRRRRATS